MKSASVHLCGAGPGSKRLGIGDDREAVPLTLQIIYSKVSEVGAEPPSQPATAAESSSPELGPRADSSVLRPSNRLPDFLWWPFSIRTLPRRQALGLWAEGCDYAAFQGAISGRSRWSNLEKVCTSVNLSKACQKPEELGKRAGEDGWEVWLGVPEPDLSYP